MEREEDAHVLALPDEDDGRERGAAAERDTDRGLRVVRRNANGE